MIKKAIGILVSAVMVVIAACGCNNTDTADEQSTFKYVGLKVYDPVYVAEEKGFFDKQGIDVEIVDTVAGGATAVQMVSSGDVQGALLSTMAICNARSSGLPVVGVADIQSAFENTPLEEFYVRKDSGIKTIEDLKGKKIAINLTKSSFHYTWLMALENAGLKPEDVTFVNLSFDQQKAALERGDVDAIGLMQPYSTIARADEDLEMLFDATDIFGEKQFCEIIVNSVWAENNPEDAEKFVTAIADATEWIEDNQDEAKSIISKYTGIEAEYIDDYDFQDNAKVVESDAEYWLDYMKRTEGVADWVTVDDIVTNKYNKKG
jgi:NitT/TauT family transport system substrate-binding protein